jgi:histidinol-phosphate aminotransferase
MHARADLAAPPSYVPEHRIPGAIQLGNNENAFGPLPRVVDAITKAASRINRYPESGATELVARLATKLDVNAAQLAVGSGSAMLCQQLIQSLCNSTGSVLFGWRSFEGYPIFAQTVGAAQIKVPLTAGHALDLNAMLAAITPETRLIFLCTPNNPTGTAVRKADLTRFLAAAPPQVLVVIDEAYREFVDDRDVPDGVEFAKEQWAAGRDQVAVVRTFSKAYGLAGLRVGYLVATEAVVAATRKVQIPFSVNSVAQAAAQASLDAEDELLARCQDIVAERVRLRAELIDLGYQLPATQANFLWLPLGELTAQFKAHCLAHNLIVRAYEGEGARVTIGTPKENDAFLAAARSFG